MNTWLFNVHFYWHVQHVAYIAGHTYELQVHYYNTINVNTRQRDTAAVVSCISQQFATAAALALWFAADDRSLV